MRSVVILLATLYVCVSSAPNKDDSCKSLCKEHGCPWRYQCLSNGCGDECVRRKESRFQPPKGCPELKCDQHCPLGYSLDSNGCDTCECCPALKCKQPCYMGYYPDRKGCNTCDCMALTELVLGLLNLQTILFAACVGLLTYYIYCKLKYRTPPGPWSVPLIGHWNIYTKKTIHRDVAALSAKYGPVIQIKVGPVSAIFLNNLDVVIEALVKKKADFSSRPSLKSGDVFSGNGKDIALAPYSATWKFQKKVAGKALRHYMHGMILENMVNDVCERIVEEMAKETEPFIMSEYIDKIVIHMLFNMCFGRKCNLYDPDVDKMLKLDLELNELLGGGFIEDIFPGITYIYKTQKWKRLEQIMKELHTFIRTELKQHMNSFDSSNIRDYTDSLLLARDEAEKEGRSEEVDMLSDDYITYILLDIFFAGLDTTRMTLDWFFSFMVENQEFQEKCQSEIDQFIDTGERPKSIDRPNLCFTEACVMETMRMGSVVSIGVPHSTICDTTVGGYDIPKDTTVVINHWALHNDASFWKDVDKFDPYRYLNKEGKMDMKPGNWLPFSAGRRVCLGEPVARTELLLIASNLLQTFRFIAPPGVSHVTSVRHNLQGVELPVIYKVVVEKRI